MIEKIFNNDLCLAIIIRSDFHSEKLEFFTSNDDSMQLGYMKKKAGETIIPHLHKIIERKIDYTKEILIIRKGILRVDFYGDDKKYIESRILGTGDILFLSEGGQGFGALEETEIFEVKQGPYLGEDDKVRFDCIDKTDIVLNEK